MADTVDYKNIAKRTIAFVSEAQFMLVETLAHKLAMTLIAEFDLAWVKLSLNKPGAIRGSRDVGVTIERHRLPAARDAGLCLRWQQSGC